MIPTRSQRKRHFEGKFAAAAIALSIAVHGANASDATWNLNPVDNNWNNPANWAPAIIPDGQAMFDRSNMTDVSEAPTATVGSILFNPGASTFTISGQDLSITGLGIINNSSVAQHFVAVSCGPNCFPISFTNSATVSGPVNFTIGPTYDSIAFESNSSAGDGNYYAEGGIIGQDIGGIVYFLDSSTAGNGTFVIDAGTVAGTYPALIWFRDDSSAGDAFIVANGANVPGVAGGIISFSANRDDNPSLGNATLICNGGVSGGEGGRISFTTFGYNQGNTSTASVKLFGNGTMNVSEAGPFGVDIGSLEGDGIVLLGVRRLSVGRNNRDTAFSGLISDYGTDSNLRPLISGTNKALVVGGRLNKTGTGRLTLTRANTYTAGTTVESGQLAVANDIGSGTGTGPVRVNTGVLSGLGTIAGTVTIGTGSGTGAILSPGKGPRKPGVLTLLGELTFKADGAFRCGINSDIASSDEIYVNGITIDQGARFLIRDAGAVQLTPGLVLTVINNTGSTPISGTFANLADGSTITVGQNAFQVSYTGGDGNDLAITVVP